MSSTDRFLTRSSLLIPERSIKGVIRLEQEEKKMNAGMLMNRFLLWATIGKFYWESQSLAEGYLWDIRFLALLHMGCKMKSAQAESCGVCSRKV